LAFLCYIPPLEEECLVAKTNHLLVAISGVAALLFAACNTRKPQYTNEVITLMAKYSNQGRFDDAIAVGLDWTKRHPNDTFGQPLLLQKIALLYLAKASKEPAHKEEWVNQAIRYSDEASVNQPDASAILQEEPFILESAGDLAPAEACVYYRRSVQQLRKQIPWLEQADPKGPRQIAEMSLVRIQKKMTNSGCK
jgi:hypothetical protein